MWQVARAKYTDAEAIAAVLADDKYVKNTGDVMSGTLEVNADLKVYNLLVEEESASWIKFTFDPGTGTNAAIDYDPQPFNNTNAMFRFFRNTITSGATYFKVMKGDGTNTTIHSFFGRGGHSFVCNDTNKFGIGTTAPTAKLDVNSDIFRLRTAKTPASAGAAGNQGDWCWDADYFYICVATNTWERTPHAWDINVYDDAAVTKLAGIETGATKYPDTGEQAFLDGDHTKLNGIEAAADVTDSTNVTASGAVMQSIIKVGAPSEVTLSDAGVATITGSHHTIDSYDDAATDTMTGIAGGVADQILILRPESSARTITIDSGFLNIALDGGADFVMDHANDQIMLLRLHDSDDWIEISRSNNGT